MNTKLIIPLTFTTSLSLISSAVIADNATDSKIFIGEVIEIKGEKNHSLTPNIAGSVDVIGREQLENEHVNITMDLFKKVPGVYFSRFNQGIISADIAIRGYNGEGSMPHTKLLIDGVPSNLHNGLNEMDALFPLEISQIEVVKGTNDPRYGLHNLAGNINIESRKDFNNNEIEVLAGNFGTQEIQTYIANQSGKLSQHYFAGYRATDGYRDNAELDKHTFSGKWFYELSPQTDIGFIARYFKYDAQAPGYLTQEEARKDPKQSAIYAQDDEGSKTTQHVSAHVSHEFSEDSLLDFKIYQQHFERERFVRYTESSSQQERQEDEKQYGFILNYTQQLNADWLIQSGIDYQHQSNRHQRYKTEQQQRINPTRDHNFDFITYGGFTQIEHKLHERVTWVAGLRVDRLDGDFTDEIAQVDRDINDYGTIVQPKLSLITQPTDELTVFANWGESFQAGIGKSAFSVEETSFDASKNTGWELGSKWLPLPDLTLRLSAWHQDASDELVQKTDGSGDFANVGETERKGWDFAFQWAISNAVYIWGSYTDQEAILTKPGNQAIDNKGNWLRGVPDYTASFGLDYWVLEDLKASAYGSYQGDYHLSNSNDNNKYGQYSIIDIALDYQLDWGNIGLRINNIFDRYYEYVYLLGDETIHSPGDGIGANLSFSYRF